ncbi:MAG: hypothetical protein ACFFHV_04050 [Promethearchaeota archaeon]
MEKENLDKVLSMIKGIEKKNLEFEKYLSNLKILSRNSFLKEIISDILENNKFFQRIRLSDEGTCLAEEELEELSNGNYIEELISKIRNEPSKRIIILREYLSKLEGIAENDLNVILKSLTNKDLEDLKKELLNLTKIFKIKNKK